MHKNFCGWSLENVGKGTVDTKYTVEHISDPKVADELERTGDPSLYDKKEFDNIEKALTHYLRYFVDDKCIILNLWEEISVNGEVVLEQRIEPSGYAKNAIREVISREMKKRMETAEREAEELRKSNELYEKFISKFGENGKEMFSEFCRQEAQK